MFNIKREHYHLNKECIGMEIDTFLKGYLSHWWVLKKRIDKGSEVIYKYSRLCGILTLEITCDVKGGKEVIKNVISNH